MSRTPVPFDNRSFGLGDLTVESAADAVAIHGSIDIRRDQQGLSAARTLAAYLAALVADLEKQNAREALPAVAALEAPVSRPNPFD